MIGCMFQKDNFIFIMKDRLEEICDREITLEVTVRDDERSSQRRYSSSGERKQIELI